MKISRGWCALGGLMWLLVAGCQAPIGARHASPTVTYRQLHANVLSQNVPTPDTRLILRRYDQEQVFAATPDATLKLIHERALASHDRNELFALAELNYLAGNRLQRSVKPWEPRDARDYYLASAVYAYFFLFGDARQPPPDGYDLRFRLACELYNNGLGWALTGRRSTNAVVVLAGGTRSLPFGSLPVELNTSGLPWPVEEFDRFLLANHFQVFGLSVRNRRNGIGVPLIAMKMSDWGAAVSRATSTTAFLRITGSLADLDQGRCRATLECYSANTTANVQIGEQVVPLEGDTTAPVAYMMNQATFWQIGRLQFLSPVERIPTDVYLSQPYEPGKVPVVFVHGTFSSPVWWAEMANTLRADEELSARSQFWFFIYNSGNPVAFSADRLRMALKAKVQEFDPEGKDPALQQMVVIGHSQGGLLTKLTATDTGQRLWEAMTTNRPAADLKLTPEQRALLKRHTVYEPLPFVKRTIFIATPHRGSFRAGWFMRGLARRFITLPYDLVDAAEEFLRLSDELQLPREFRGQIPTSIDTMSPDNKWLLALADIPLAPGVAGHSIIAVRGNGDYRQGNDGWVTFQSAHVDYVESEFIVRSGHSCQSEPATIEEVRRILHEHLDHLPAGVTSTQTGRGAK
jgi:pimeloyl-ACP methyl ester carboxylesterase